VLFQDQELFQLRWNGADKAIKLDANENIWSSSTLYPKKSKNGLIYFRHFREKHAIRSKCMIFIGTLKEIKKMAWSSIEMAN
jgi:hypothetical protein